MLAYGIGEKCAHLIKKMWRVVGDGCLRIWRGASIGFVVDDTLIVYEIMHLSGLEAM